MNTDLDSIGVALARIPSGCSILTAQHGERASGMLVSWVQQASFEPPCISVCLKRGRPIQTLVDEADCFVLNVIGDDPTRLFKHFGKGFALDQDAFAGVETTPSEFGPVIKECIAHLGCRVTQRVAAGDHDLYIAEVAAATAKPGAQPYVHIRKNGLSY